MDDDEGFEIPGPLTDAQLEAINEAMSVVAMRAHESGHEHERERVRARLLSTIALGLSTAALAVGANWALWPLLMPWLWVVVRTIAEWVLTSETYQRRRAVKSTVAAAERFLRET